MGAPWIPAKTVTCHFTKTDFVTSCTKGPAEVLKPKTVTGNHIKQPRTYRLQVLEANGSINVLIAYRS